MTLGRSAQQKRCLNLLVLLVRQAPLPQSIRWGLVGQRLPLALEFQRHLVCLVDQLRRLRQQTQGYLAALGRLADQQNLAAQRAQLSPGFLVVLAARLHLEAQSLPLAQWGQQDLVDQHPPCHLGRQKYPEFLAVQLLQPDPAAPSIQSDQPDRLPLFPPLALQGLPHLVALELALYQPTRPRPKHAHGYQLTERTCRRLRHQMEARLAHPQHL